VPAYLRATIRQWLAGNDVKRPPKPARTSARKTAKKATKKSAKKTTKKGAKKTTTKGAR
jgi:hypothetical protein